MAARIKNSVSSLTSILELVSRGHSARALPPSIKSLRVAYHGLKGNAGARHWAKESLGSIKNFNPHVNITVVPKVVKLRRGRSTVETSEVEVIDSWKQPPGIYIGFHESTKEAFFPLTPARSETLVKRFWDVIDSPEALEGLKSGKETKAAVEVKADSIAVEVEEPEMILDGITEAQVKKNL